MLQLIHKANRSRRCVVCLPFLALVVVGQILIVPTAASAATYVGCNPGRANDDNPAGAAGLPYSRAGSPYYRWDGWMYPSTYPSSQFPTSGTVGQGASGPTIGGVYSSLTTYANYNDNAHSDYDWQWVMLTDDVFGGVGSGGRWAQIGPMTGDEGFELGGTPPFSPTYTPSAYGGTSQQSRIMVQYTAGNTVQTIQPNWSVNPGANFTYSVLYNYYGLGDMTFWVNWGSGPYLVWEDTGTDIGYWRPTQGEVMAETHSNADQVFGDVFNSTSFAGTNVYYTPSGGSANWYAIDTSNHASIAHNSWSGANSPSNTTGEATNFAWQVASSSQLNIWDMGCPVSITSGPQIPVRHVFDDLNGQQDLTSLAPNQTNGPYYLVAQTDGDYVVYDGHNHPIWATNAPGAGRYMSMQGDDNLVEYQGAGGGAVWTSGTAGRGYSSPYAVIQSDGNLVVYGDASHPLWATGTNWDSTNSGLFYGQTLSEGYNINSMSNTYHLAMQTDCNLVLYNSNWSPVWSSRTNGYGSGCHLDLQSDGNLVLYRYAGSNTALWSSGSSGTGSWNHMVVNNNGTFTVADFAGGIHYTS